MARIPYLDDNNTKLFSALKMYSRTNALPLDPTSVFESKEQVEAYINATGSYAYAGQIVAVANGDLDSGSVDFSVFVIKADKTLQDITHTRTFDSLELATAFVAANTAVAAGELITVKNGTKFELYTIGTDRSLSRMSFDVGDVPEVTWENLQNKPTSTVQQIDDAVATAEKITEADGKVSYNGEQLAKYADITWANVAGKPEFGTGAGQFAEGDHTHDETTITGVNASAIKGVISIENLPAGALERCVVVADDTARFALTTEQVQTGDTVKVTSSGKMYMVVDDAKLAEEAGYEVYTAGAATEVPWSGVTGKPDTLGGYGITDAVNVSEVVETASANKILKLNADGKLPADITGDAATLGGKAPSEYANASHTHGNADITDVDWSKVDNTPTTISGYGITDAVNVSEVVDIASANKILKLNAEGKLPASITGDAATLGGKSVDYFATANHTHTAADVGAVDATEVVDAATPNKILKLNAEGKLPADITGDAATVGGKAASAFAEASHTHGNADITDVDWSKVDNTPTTIAGYGITDAVNVSEVVETAEANKILKLNGDAKLPASITGDAATVGGKAASAFAEASHTHGAEDITSVNASAIQGVISINNLPHGALERCVVVADDTARFALTTAQVQTGDTVKVTSSGKMYFVTDDSKLSTEEGYEVYTAGSATSVPWSGITGKPEFGTGAGQFAEGNHTHTAADVGAVSTDDVVTEANAGNAGKLLALNAEGKLDVDITGSVAWAKILDKPTSTVTEIDEAVAASKHTNRATLDKLTESAEGKLLHDSNEVAYKADLFKIVVSATEPEGLAVGSMWFEEVSSQTV